MTMSAGERRPAGGLGAAAAAMTGLAAAVLRGWLGGARRLTGVFLVTALAAAAAGLVGSWADGRGTADPRAPGALGTSVQEPGLGSTTGPGATESSAATAGPVSVAASTVGAVPLPRPGAAGGLTVTDVNATAGTTRLCWQAARGADAYSLDYRDATAGATGWTRMPYPIRELCYTTQLLVPGHTYEFRITSANSSGFGPPSNTVSATLREDPPGAATDLTLKSVGPTDAQLCWQAAPGADAYSLDYRDVTAGAADLTRMPYPIKELCYDAQLLLTGHTYEFRVIGANGGGTGPPSNTISVTPKA